MASSAADVGKESSTGNRDDDDDDDDEKWKLLLTLYHSSTVRTLNFFFLFIIPIVATIDRAGRNPDTPISIIPIMDALVPIIIHVLLATTNGFIFIVIFLKVVDAL